MQQLLFLIFFTSFFISLQAQKEIKNGQFLYYAYNINGDTKDEAGRAIVLKRGDLIRFDYLTPEENGRKDVYFRAMINNATDKLKVKMTLGKEVLLDQEVKISEANQLLRSSAFGNYVIQKNRKNSKNFEPYKTIEYNCIAADEKEAPSIKGYLAPKIHMENHPFFVVLAFGLPLKGFPFEFGILNNGQLSENFVLESFSMEQPDAIWFDLDKTPVYPLYNKEQTEQPKDAITPFLWRESELYAEIMEEQENLMYKNLEKQFSSQSLSRFKELEKDFNQLHELYESWVNELPRPVGPEDKTGVAQFFSVEKQARMAALWDENLKAVVQLNKELREKEQLSGDAAIELEDLESFRPSATFSLNLETYQSLTILQAFAVIRHFQNNNRLLKIKLMEHLLKGKGKIDLVYDQFEVFHNPTKPYILLGETYESEIMLGAYSSQANISVSVDGRRLAVEDGKAKYSTTSRTLGEQSYTAKIAITNPLTGMIETVSKDFSYEVGVPSATIAADKMNVVYLGIDNPISVAAAGISSNDLEVFLSDPSLGELEQVARGKFSIIPKKVGMLQIEMKDKRRGRTLARFQFRVKRIPNPQVRIGMEASSGSTPAAKLNQMRGLTALLENFDFDAKCTVSSFQLHYYAADGKNKSLQNTAAAFKGEVLEVIQNAKAGDSFIFSDIKVRCNGDQAARRVDNLGIVVE
jgi:hypothetical protein